MTFAVRTFFGAGGVINPIPINSFGRIALDPADATVTLEFDTDGDGSMQGNVTNAFEWFSPVTPGIGTGYWIRLTVNSGTSPSGSAVGSWLQLSSARSWSLTRTTIGTFTGNYTLEIATDSGGTNIVASQTINMTAQVTV
jgi:hypothetical protein